MNIGYSEAKKLINFPALTGFRAFAALLVFFHHFPPITADLPLYYVLLEGHLGVTLFFVLSGFLISYRYSDSHAFSFSWWKTYVQNRFARIYPVFFLITVLGFRLKNETDLTVWVTNLTMTKAWFESLMFTGIGPAWSLSVEEVFYISAPLFFLLFRRIGFWLTLLSCYLVGLCLLGIGSNIDFYGFFANFKFVVLATFWGRAFEFLLGMQLAILFKAGTLPSALRSFKYKTHLGFLGVFLVMFGLSLITASDSSFHNSTASLVGIAVNNLILPPFVALLIWGLIDERSMARTVLSSKPLVLLGGASYAFYLAQQSVISDILHLLGFKDVSTQYFPAMLLISIILYLGFELPLHKLLKAKDSSKLKINSNAVAEVQDISPASS